MKRFLLASTLALLLAGHSLAANHAISAQSNGSSCNSGGSFTPSTLTIAAGDTVSISLPANDPYAGGWQIHGFPQGNFTVLPGQTITTQAINVASVSFSGTWPSTSCFKGSGTITVTGLNPSPSPPSPSPSPSPTPSPSPSPSPSGSPSPSPSPSSKSSAATSSGTSATNPTASGTTASGGSSAKTPGATTTNVPIAAKTSILAVATKPTNLIGFIVFIALIGGLIYWIIKRRPKSPQAPPPSTPPANS